MVDEVKDTAASPDTGVDVQGDVEERARAQGWKAKDEYDRDPENWVDANTFLKRAESSASIRNERLRKMSDDLKSARLEIAEMKKAVKQFGDYHQRALLAEREKAIKELQARQERAVEEGDVPEYRKITQEINEEVKAINAIPQPAPQGPPPEAAAFLDKYRLAMADPAFQGAAYGISRELDQKGVFGPDHFRILEDRLLKYFPQYVTAPATADDSDDEEDDHPPRRKSGVPPLEQGRSASRGTATKKSRGYDDLTGEGKAACDLFIKQGLIKDRKEYVAALDQNDKEIWAR